MSAIEGAKKHFTDIGVQSMEVPEWGTDGVPLVIYWKPMTLEQKQRLMNFRDRDGYIASLADAIIMKAQDAQGKPLFTIQEKFALRHEVDPDVLSRIVTRMMASPGVKEMGKS